jgi:hypothetical protein
MEEKFNKRRERNKIEARRINRLKKKMGREEYEKKGGNMGVQKNEKII